MAGEAEEEVYFHTNYGRREMMASSVSSLVDGHAGINPFDFTAYMDQVSTTLSKQSTSSVKFVAGTSHNPVQRTPGACPSIFCETWGSIRRGDGHGR